MIDIAERFARLEGNRYLASSLERSRPRAAARGGNTLIENLKKLFVGNLPWSASDADLKDLFTEIGTVHSAVVITDRETGRSRGFGFVDMDDSDAETAIRDLDGQDMGGRPLRVNEAQSRPRR